MSDQNENEMSDFDFSIDVAGVSTERPVIQKKDYVLKIADVTASKNKKATGYNLIVDFATTEDTTALSGDVVKQGHKIRKYLPLQANPEKMHEATYDPDGYKKDLARLYDAATGNSDAATRPPLTLQLFKSLVEKTVLATVTIDNDEQMGKQNSIAMYSLKTNPL